MTVLTVDACVLINGGRIMLTQRMPPRDFAFCWECPGGKREDGESGPSAATRELREELGLTIPSDFEPEPLFFELVEITDWRRVRLNFWLITSAVGCLQSNDGQGVGWFAPEELTRIARTPGNRMATQRLIDIIRWRPNATRLMLVSPGAGR